MSKSTFRVARRVVSALTATATVATVGGSALLGLAVAPADFGLVEGDVISAHTITGDPDVYIVNEQGYKRLFVNPAIFNLYGHLGFDKVKSVSAATRDAFPTSGLFRNCESGAQAVYGLEVVSEDQANLHHINISGAQAVAEDPDFFKKVFCINNNEQALYGTGAQWTSLSQVPDYERGETNGDAPDDGDTSGDGLNGTAGALNSVKLVGSLSGEEVGEGENNVEVIGLDLETDSGSDVRLLAVRISLKSVGDTSIDLDDVADEVSVWLDGEKIGESDVDDFTESSNVFTRSIAVSGDTIIRLDSDARLTVAVSALNNLDSADLDKNWSVSIDSIRFVDAQGAITTDATSGVLPGVLGTSASGGADQLFTFQSFASATSLKLDMKVDSANNPKVSVVEIASDSDTDGVLLLAGTLKAKGSDIFVEEMTFNIATSGATLATIADTFRLEIDGVEVDQLSASSCTVAAGATRDCVFDDVDHTVDKDDTVPFRLYVDVNGTEDHAEGASLTATATNTSTVAEDMNGDKLASSAKTGSVTGRAQSLYSWAIQLSLISTTQSKATSDNAPDLGTFTIKFRARAFGGDVYLQEGCTSAALASGAVNFQLLSAGVSSGSSSCTLVPDDNSIDDDSSFGNFKVIDGESEDFTLTVVENGADTFVSINLQGVDWATGDITDPANLYNFNLQNFKTDDLFLSST